MSPGISVIPAGIRMPSFPPVSSHIDRIPCASSLVLLAYFIRIWPVEQICSRYSITASMLYRFVHLFQKQKALWLGVLEDASVSGENFIALMDGAFVRDFFRAFPFSFLGWTGDTDPSLQEGRHRHRDAVT